MQSALSHSIRAALCTQTPHSEVQPHHHPHVASLQGLLEDVQASLLREAREFRDANIVDVSSYEELQAAVAEGALLLEGEGAGEADSCWKWRAGHAC